MSIDELKNKTCVLSRKLADPKGIPPVLAGGMVGRVATCAAGVCAGRSSRSGITPRWGLTTQPAARLYTSCPSGAERRGAALTGRLSFHSKQRRTDILAIGRWCRFAQPPANGWQASGLSANATALASTSPSAAVGIQIHHGAVSRKNSLLTPGVGTSGRNLFVPRVTMPVVTGNQLAAAPSAREASTPMPGAFAGQTR